jgi:hypothetical protein
MNEEARSQRTAWRPRRLLFATIDMFFPTGFQSPLFHDDSLSQSTSTNLKKPPQL